MPQRDLISRQRLSKRAKLAGGQPISELMTQALAQPDLISLAAGFVDSDSLPVEAVREAMDVLLSDPQQAKAALQYGSTPGSPQLREALLERLRADDGDPVCEAELSIDQVLIGAGSNQLLHLVIETLLDPQDIVLCAAPSYFVFLGMLANLDLRSVGVATDEGGMIPEALEQELARCEAAGDLPRVKAIYVCSYFDNPSGTTLSALRRGQIVEIVRRWSKKTKIYIIEDAAYRQLRYSGPDVPSMRAFDEAGDTVILADTFSKSFSPGVRVGWVVLPRHLIDPVTDQKGNIDFGSPNLNQCLMATVLQRGLYDPQIERFRENYRSKRDAMLQAADEHLAGIEGARWHRPAGGLYVWLRLPEHVDAGPSGPLVEAALAAGVLYVPGEYCYPSEGAPREKNTMRLSFGVQSCEKIRHGIEALARAIASV
ncbi:MAG: PLP-dependent aminotransferase family protein [Planctomycetes bacterium]|nr:PLP-dependent aminotransferase family protein [Planctomycetota bacterium]